MQEKIDTHLFKSIFGVLNFQQETIKKTDILEHLNLPSG